MVITNLSVQKNNPDRVNVFVDGAYVLSLFISQVADEKLKIGIELTDHDIKHLVELSDEGKLRMRVVEWLFLRPRSERELRQYLIRKKCDKVQIETLISSVQKNGYQDDNTFTEWWISQRRAQHKSAKYIRNELWSKGVSPDVIDRNMGDSNSENMETLKALIMKKRKITRYQDDQKLIIYLQRQGYPYREIQAAMNGD